MNLLASFQRFSYSSMKRPYKKIERQWFWWTSDFLEKHGKYLALSIIVYLISWYLLIFLIFGILENLNLNEGSPLKECSTFYYTFFCISINLTMTRYKTALSILHFIIQKMAKLLTLTIFYTYLALRVFIIHQCLTLFKKQ